MALRNRAGVHGRASDLVGYDDDLQRIVQALLGRYLVVDDLQVARSLLAELTGGWSMVTLTGEIARSGGAVTGGAAVRESGMLSRERELRDLPESIRLRRETMAKRPWVCSRQALRYEQSWNLNSGRLKNARSC